MALLPFHAELDPAVCWQELGLTLLDFEDLENGIKSGASLSFGTVETEDLVKLLDELHNNHEDQQLSFIDSNLSDVTDDCVVFFSDSVPSADSAWSDGSDLSTIGLCESLVFNYEEALEIDELIKDENILGYQDPEPKKPFGPLELKSKQKKESIPILGKKVSKCYKEPEKKIRKKEQNKNASSKYRQKKKIESQIMQGEYEVELERNRKLKAAYAEKLKEFGVVRELLLDVLKCKGITLQ